MTGTHNRELGLKDRFNDGIIACLGIEQKDYYSKITNSQMLGLKTLLSDVNNIITLKIASRLAERICQTLNLDCDTKHSIENIIRTTKPNANGYDIECPAPLIIAECKCNIPINKGDKFGSAQKTSLEKDIKGLLYGKSKSKIQFKDAMKFLGLLDEPKIRQAVDSYLKNRMEFKGRLIIEPNQGLVLDVNHVYIIYVKL